MMKRLKLKAFTLIELILVMGIMAILMAAIMRMFEPMRATFLDTTFYESQRTAQNGILKYITESTRYATDISVDNTNSDVTSAVREFCEDVPSLEDGDVMTVDIIYIDNNVVQNNFYKGRLYKAKVEVEVNGTPGNFTFDIGSIDRRLVLGNGYYGNYTYSIGVVPNLADKTLSVSIASIVTNRLPEQRGAVTDEITTAWGSNFVKTESEVVLQNTSDTRFYNKLNSPTPTDGIVTYIIYLNPEAIESP